MNEQIQKWLDYCEGKVECEESNFIGLLHHKWHRTELDIIFKYVPFQNRVVDNLEEFLFKHLG